MKKWLALIAYLSILTACDKDNAEPSSNVSGNSTPTDSTVTSSESSPTKAELLVVCPPPLVSGYGTYSGSESHPISTMHGHVSILESMGPPIKFTSSDREVVLSGVHYEGTVSDTYVVPTAGMIELLSIDGEAVDIESGDISTGCLATPMLGEILILFESSLLAEAVTVVMTEDQIEKLK